MVTPPSTSYACAVAPAFAPVTRAIRARRDRPRLPARRGRVRALPGARDRRVRAQWVRGPAAVGLERVVQRPTVLGRLADHAVPAVCRLDEHEDRRLVPLGLGPDQLVGRVEARIRAHQAVAGIELEGVHEDALVAVGPVDLVAVGDVQAARLHRRVAVGRGHVLGEGHQRRMVLGVHVAGDVGAWCNRTATGSAARRCGR